MDCPMFAPAIPLTNSIREWYCGDEAKSQQESSLLAPAIAVAWNSTGLEFDAAFN
jgi:hypothetical protein